MGTSLAHEVRIAQAVVEAILAAGVEAEDPDLAELADGECDLIERLRRMLRYARHVEAQAKALAEMQADMKARKARLDGKAEALRSSVAWAMSEVGLSKVEAPDLTASLSSGRPKVVITDEAALADGLCRIKREPDKALILAALIRHEEVPGAELANGSPTLTVRTR